jgi:hypothetical protein
LQYDDDKKLTMDKPKIIENQKNAFSKRSVTAATTRAKGVYIKYRSSTEEARLLNRNNRKLEHHGQESVSPKFLGNAAHDQLVEYRADQERDDHSHWLREVTASGPVDVAEEEVVNRYVPLAREFHPR